MNIRKLLGLCEHKWSIIKSKINYFGFYNENEDRFNTTEICIMKCERCGNLKVKEIPFVE